MDGSSTTSTRRTVHVSSGSACDGSSVRTNPRTTNQHDQPKTGGTMTGLRRVLLAALIFTIPASAFAQEAVLTGTITDSTGAVLPGVTVTVVHQASGNRFVAVTVTP